MGKKPVDFDKVLEFAAENSVLVRCNPLPFNFTVGTKGPH